MRKTILFLLTLLFIGALGAHAQPDSWSYVGDNYSATEHIVYVSLVDDSGNAVYLNDSSDWIGAFIGDECRGAAKARSRLVGNNGIHYFPLRIKGTADDNGKAVTFRYWRQMQGSNNHTEYTLTATTALTYSNEATTGMLSDLFTLVFNQPRYFTFPEQIEVRVGETVDLLSKFTWEPANATIPTNIEWDVANSARFVAVKGNTLEGLSPTEGAWIGIDGLYDIKSVNGNYSTTVKVVQPITGLELKPEYLKGDSVLLNDSLALGRILRNCYVMTPADANEALTWTWDDADAITYTTDDEGEHWEPAKAGRYKLTLTGGDHSIVLPLTILNPLNEIHATLSDFHVFVGENVADFLPYAVAFSPSEFVDTRVTYTVDNDTAKALRYESDQSIIAQKPGTSSVYIASEQLPNAPVMITVTVHPNVTAVAVADPTLTYEQREGGQDITQDIFANLMFTPDKTYRPQGSELETSDEAVCQGPTYDNNGAFTFTTGELGSAVISFYKSVAHTVLSADNTLSNTTVDLKAGFTVSVVQGLTGFTLNSVEMGRYDSQTLTLTPVPDGARVDADNITIKITNRTLPEAWTLATVAKDDASGLSYTVTPQAVGSGTIVVYYGGERFGSQTIRIGQSFTQKAGWQWVTPFGGYVADIETLYGSALQEMRSQTAVMYNDPQYGYFGDLSAMYRNGCYKVKIKDGESVEAVNSNVDYTAGETELTLRDKWNWIGLPYQYDHPVAAALGSDRMVASLSEGDRIVSKDDFTEFDGKTWNGTLTTLTAGEGYLFYNAGGQSKTLTLTAESELGQPSPNGAKARAKRRKSAVWQYDADRFADNMTVVADLGDAFASDRYTVGAYVGDECRGEGTFVNGKWFITVHGDAGAVGQAVTFRVHDTMTGQTYTVDGRRAFTPMVGTLRAPLRMTVDVTTGIDGVSTVADEADSDAPAQYFTIDGKRVDGRPDQGVYIVRQGNAVRKIIVK